MGVWLQMMAVAAIFRSHLKVKISQTKLTLSSPTEQEKMVLTLSAAKSGVEKRLKIDAIEVLLA